MGGDAHDPYPGCFAPDGCVSAAAHINPCLYASEDTGMPFQFPVYQSMMMLRARARYASTLMSFAAIAASIFGDGRVSTCATASKNRRTSSGSLFMRTT